MSDKRSILCFGDSLTWGWIPVEESSPTLRYPYHQRWTGAMASQLGDGYHIVEEGLSARTTTCDDPNDRRLNGSTYLPTALASHLPLDLVILMLGTNDTKSYFHRTSYEIANGMAKLVGQVNEAARAGIETSHREGSAENSPAVHVDRLSGDGARLVGAEKKRRLRDFRRGLAAPLQD